MKILVTGAKGMLAYDLIPILQQEYTTIGHDKSSLDIVDVVQITTVLDREKVDLVINCAAYTDVENAEGAGKKSNYTTNTLGIYTLAKVCARMGVDLIHISTDYVFDGKKTAGYYPDDVACPINAYGMAKYLGEELLFSEHSDAIIVRTSWLYGGGAQFKNFVNTMLTLSDTRKELQIVGDQFGRPTYTKDLSGALLAIIKNISSNRGNIFHLSNHTDDGGISWYDFAKEIFKLTKKDITLHKCMSTDFETKANRPQHSVLLNNSDLIMRDWKSGLQEYLHGL